VLIENNPVDAQSKGWITTSLPCQNVILNSKEGVSVNIGNAHRSIFPYFSQKDLLWTDQEYDHGNTHGPFFCGTTMEECGCAVTSSAMLLKYHGAHKSPSGEATNPQTLNNWLKENNGYAFGALKWNSIASYSVKASQTFGTQKIRFVGTGPPNDFGTLDDELASQKPTVLAQPGHFVLATEKQGSTYSIADPAFENKTSLESYSNQFLGTRRFEKTNTDLSSLYLSTPSPNDLFIVDSQGRRVGKDPVSGQVYAEIPNSFYFLESSLSDQSQTNPAIPNNNDGVNMLVIINPQNDIYNLKTTKAGPVDLSAYDTLGEINSIVTSTAKPTNFEINYSATENEDFKVEKKINVEFFPNTFKLSSTYVMAIVKKAQGLDTLQIEKTSVSANPSQTKPEQTFDLPFGAVYIFRIRDLNLNLSTKEVCLRAKMKDNVGLFGCGPVKIY
jgi:hypothetical protein